MKNKDNKEFLETVLNEINLSEEEINEELILKKLTQHNVLWENRKKTLHKHKKRNYRYNC